ncbi:MAG: hypothetical protein ACRYF4_04375 [Janthinobacterium lividum]
MIWPRRIGTVSVLLLAGSLAAQAQGRGMGGGMGRGGGMGFPHGGGGMGMPGGRTDGGVPGIGRSAPPPASNGAPSSSMRGGLQLAPPGRWWNDKKFAKSLGLNGDQQRRMDSVFGQNRDALVQRFETLQKAEGRLESLTHSAKPSEAALFGEIDHVAQARADLEKANTHMLLQLRDEMSAEQIGKLDDHR